MESIKDKAITKLNSGATVSKHKSTTPEVKVKGDQKSIYFPANVMEYLLDLSKNYPNVAVGKFVCVALLELKDTHGTDLPLEKLL